VLEPMSTAATRSSNEPMFVDESMKDMIVCRLSIRQIHLDPAANSVISAR
jgi:hypothetical protein